MAYWEEEVSSGFVRVVGTERVVLIPAGVFALVVHQMVSNDGMDFHFTEEAAFGFDHAE